MSAHVFFEDWPTGGQSHTGLLWSSSYLLRYPSISPRIDISSLVGFFPSVLGFSTLRASWPFLSQPPSSPHSNRAKPPTPKSNTPADPHRPNLRAARRSRAAPELRGALTAAPLRTGASLGSKTHTSFSVVRFVDPGNVSPGVVRFVWSDRRRAGGPGGANEIRKGIEVQKAVIFVFWGVVGFNSWLRPVLLSGEVSKWIDPFWDVPPGCGNMWKPSMFQSHSDPMVQPKLGPNDRNRWPDQPTTAPRYRGHRGRRVLVVPFACEDGQVWPTFVNHI